jgi:N-acetylglucosamine-6-phosphate deacetylase
LRVLCGQVITPDEVLGRSVVEIDGGKIVRVGPPDGAPVDIDASDKIATPGFIDIHIHGGAGYEAMDGSLEGIRATSDLITARGVTSWLPSPLTGPWSTISAAVNCISSAMTENYGAEILGANLEGPYLNPTKNGAQPADYIRAPKAGEMKSVLGDLISVVRYVALAPELPGALDLIRELTSMGIVVALGHTEATYEEARAGFDAGATSLTHTYNAMRPLRHRDPGILGAALLDDRVTIELIWDNYHVHEAAARIAVKLKSPDRVALISDAVSAAGLGDGDYHLSGQAIHVENSFAHLADGAIAGSTITLNQAVKNAAQYFPLQDAVKMATTTPARLIGVGDRKGRIAPGYDADIVLLRDDFSVDTVMVKGRVFGNYE